MKVVYKDPQYFVMSFPTGSGKMMAYGVYNMESDEWLTTEPTLAKALKAVEKFKEDSTYLEAILEEKAAGSLKVIPGVPDYHVIQHKHGIVGHPFGLGRDVFGPDIPDYIYYAHELGHQQAEHKISDRSDRGHILNQEEEAWRNAARFLRRSGEWGESAKEIAAKELGTYYNDLGAGGIDEAREFIDAL